MEPKSRRVSGSDGLMLHVLEWSEEGVPLLMLHGYGNEAHIWDDFAPSVAPYYRALAIDQRGHGDSEWDSGRRYDIDAMVRDLESLTEALSIDRMVIVGHSMGGRVATLFGDRNSKRMAGLALVDIGPEVDPRGVSRIRMDVESNRDPNFGSIEQYARVLSLAYPAAKPHALMRMARHGVRIRDDGRFELKSDPALRSVFQAREGGEPTEAPGVDNEPRLWEALGRIPCPTLVVRGAASDILSPDVADRMVDDVLANGTLAVVAQAGHSVMTDNPDGFRDAVTSFVLAEE